MRTFGIIVAIVCGAVGGLYFGGYLDGKVDVEPTDKGKQAVTDVLNGTREGINSGLENLTNKVNEGLDKAKIEKAPRLKDPKPEPDTK